MSTIVVITAMVRHMPKDPRLQLAMRVRQLRMTAGISQEELAHIAGLHRTYVGGIERGERNPTLVALLALANALDTDLAGLIAGIR